MEKTMWGGVPITPAIVSDAHRRECEGRLRDKFEELASHCRNVSRALEYVSSQMPFRTPPAEWYRVGAEGSKESEHLYKIEQALAELSASCLDVRRDIGQTRKEVWPQDVMQEDRQRLMEDDELDLRVWAEDKYEEFLAAGGLPGLGL
jgi:hypothetical protein